MNTFNQIQIIYIPWWARLLILALVIAVVGLAGYLLFEALFNPERDTWVEAAAILLAVVFPILIIAIVLGGGAIGDQSIIRRTEHILRDTIPYHLQFIPEEAPKFKDFRKIRRSPKTAENDLAAIQLFHTKGRCYADYRITVPRQDEDLYLRMRVELNVKRVNLNIVFPRESLLRKMEEAGATVTLPEFLRKQFPHSLEVEKLQADAIEAGSSEGGGTIAYRFNQEFLTRTVDGKDYIVVVATTRVADDLVWSPSEKVFFAQDLMFMIRAFMQENADMFREEKPIA